MKTLFQFKSVLELVRTFDTVEKCIQYLKQLRWKDTIECPHCQNSEKKIYKYKNGKMYKCSSCQKQFNVTTNTIFQGTHISLKNWFYVLYTFVNHKKGISSIQISKDLGITIKSAWAMLYKIRYAMKDRKGKLSGEVEVDETFIGGKNHNHHYNKRVKNSQGRSLKTKAGIYGFVERDGRVRTIRIRKMYGKGMRLLFAKFVDTSSIIYSDEYKGYRGLNKMFKGHKIVNHGAYQYVDGDKTTNTIETFWSHLKRGIVGTYHSISKKLIHRYCVEFEYRWNMIKKSDEECFETVITQSFGKRMTWDIVTCSEQRY